MKPDYDPTQEYITSLKKVIVKEITWEAHHHNARELMLLALCRSEVKVDPDTVIKIRKLEAQACAIAGVPATKEEAELMAQTHG